VKLVYAIGVERAGHRPKIPASDGLVSRGGSKPENLSYEWLKVRGHVKPLA
jgi:hypothetical protein